MVARSGREFAVAHSAQLPAERLLGDRDAEFLEDPLRQIDQPPAHHAMDRRDRAALDQFQKNCSIFFAPAPYQHARYSRNRPAFVSISRESDLTSIYSVLQT